MCMYTCIVPLPSLQLAHAASFLRPLPSFHRHRLGTYDPLPREGVKHVTIDLERTKYWLSVGANPTEPVAKLLAKVSRVQAAPHHRH